MFCKMTMSPCVICKRFELPWNGITRICLGLGICQDVRIVHQNLGSTTNLLLFGIFAFKTIALQIRTKLYSRYQHTQFCRPILASHLSVARWSRRNHYNQLTFRYLNSLVRFIKMMNIRRTQVMWKPPSPETSPTQLARSLLF